MLNLQSVSQSVLELGSSLLSEMATCKYTYTLGTGEVGGTGSRSRPVMRLVFSMLKFPCLLLQSSLVNKTYLRETGFEGGLWMELAEFCV
jgi:hypothetical protein